MTDFSKYKNVSLSNDTYTKLDSLRRVIVPNTTLSRAQTVNILVNEKVEKLIQICMFYCQVSFCGKHRKIIDLEALTGRG